VNTASPAWHAFRSRVGQHVLVVRGSQILDLPADRGADSLEAADLADYLSYGDRVDLDTIPVVAPQGISLNVTSACNLGCTYCYADRGQFHGAQRGAMQSATARAAIDTLLASCARSAPATIGFIGGEPFLHPALVHDIVGYAGTRAAELGQPIGFSVTTNGTRLTPADHQLIRAHRFAVTVSIDGGPATHDLTRRNLLGHSSYADTITGISPLLADSGNATVSARATVVSGHPNLTERYDALRSEGFGRIGFSPVRLGFGSFTDGDWTHWITESVGLAERELAVLLNGGDTAYDNLTTALRRLHTGSCSPFPCGAGGGYASVSTDGRWFACHRAIGNDDYGIGDADLAVDPRRQHAFLQERHVDAI
jgi:uncharacterized protein